MFEKLLALVPYNPGMVAQLRFYGQRMHEEAAIRRIGLIFIVLTFFVQFFAVLSPPQPSVAASGNDLINGGVSSAADAANQCERGTQKYGIILGYYGISCNDVRRGDDMTIHSGARDYYSAGHISLGGRNPSTGKVTHEFNAKIPGVSNDVYWRLLNSWDSASSAPYSVIRVTSHATGKTYYIIKGCGNLVYPGPPTPYTPPSTPTPPAPTPPPPAPTPPPTPTPPAPCPYNNSILATDATCVQCPYNNSIVASNPACKPCDKSTNSQDSLACVKVHKTAANLTAGLTDANNSTAKPSDVIEYTLFAENNGKATVTHFVFQENMSDVLDYATITDPHGGTLDSTTGMLGWPPGDIAAGQTATVKVTVKVKNPIPATPRSSSDPNRFDLIMTNVYGNAINIKVPTPPAKQVEMAAATLPNTGPGSSLAMIGAVVIIAGYFYSRARLLARESELAIKELAT